MTPLTTDRLEELLEPFIGGTTVPDGLYEQLCVYLDLLLRWNLRTNLTSVREPEAIVTRHFGESLFLARHLPKARTLLDYGSGAGFPGMPLQLMLPTLNITLAESQGKKASFLREAVRTLGLPTEVWSRRVETMDPVRTFDIVALRAVDKMEEASHDALSRLSPGGTLALLVSGMEGGLVIPGTHSRMVQLSKH